MKDDFKELNLDELDAVAGGRKITDNEWRDYAELATRANKKLIQLRDEGRTEELNSLYDRTRAAVNSWHAAIKAAPEGSPDIPFSDYISMDEFE